MGSHSCHNHKVQGTYCLGGSSIKEYLVILKSCSLHSQCQKKYACVSATACNAITGERRLFDGVLRILNLKIQVSVAFSWNLTLGYCSFCIELVRLFIKQIHVEPFFEIAHFLSIYFCGTNVFVFYCMCFFYLLWYLFFNRYFDWSSLWLIY